MNSNTLPYASYLVRLWQSGDADDGETAVAHTPHYFGEVEHIQTGRRRPFHNPADLWAFLQQNIPPGEQNETFND